MLTTAQLSTLKADIAANPDLTSQPLSNLGSVEIARLYNLASTTDVWRTEAPINEIYNAIDWAKYTPVDAPAPSQTYTNQVLCIQTKQMNLQNMLVGRAAVDASKANVRAGLRDAVTQLPAGTAGANISAGGAGGVDVLMALTRKATRFEKLFATASATTGTVTANLLVVEGKVSPDEVQTAREMA